MELLKPAPPARRLFAGLFGSEGSGKSYTATTLACYARHRFGLDGPVAALDTEQGMCFRAPYVREKTGKDLLLLETRDIDKVEPFLKECSSEGVSIAIIDSLTHILTTLRDRSFKARGVVDPQPGDYVVADRQFKEILDKMLAARMNIIICGRESQVYGRYKNSRGKMVNGPIGTKMGAGKAGYEVDLLIHCQREDLKGGGVRRYVNIDKDRSDSMAGDTFDVPYNFAERFSPYFDFLVGEE